MSGMSCSRSTFTPMRYNANNQRYNGTMVTCHEQCQKSNSIKEIKLNNALTQNNVHECSSSCLAVSFSAPTARMLSGTDVASPQLARKSGPKFGPMPKLLHAWLALIGEDQVVVLFGPLVTDPLVAPSSSCNVVERHAQV